MAGFMIFARLAFPSPFLAAESGRHVDAAEAVAGGAGRDRPGGAGGVPQGQPGDPGPG